MKRNKRRIFLIVLLFLLGGGLIFAYRYAVHHVAYTSDAYIEANVVPISPEVSGHVRRIYVLDNQDVKAGDPLFEIDPDPFLYAVRQKQGMVSQTIKMQKALRQQLEAQVAEIAMMESELDISRDHWRRAVPLLEQQYMSEEEGANIYFTLKRNEAAVAQAYWQLQQVEAELGPSDEPFAETVIAEAERDEAQYRLTRTTIFAPCDGRVTNFYVRPGQFVEQGRGLFAIVDTSVWWVTARFKDLALSSIEPGAKAKIWIDMYWSHLFEGRVESVGYGVNRAQASPDATQSTLPYLEQTEFWIRLSQRFPVRVKVEQDPKHPLRVGANCRIFIGRASRSGSNFMESQEHEKTRRD